MGLCCSNGRCKLKNSVSAGPIPQYTRKMACELCAAKFSLIKRKWICSECSHEFCSACITRQKTLAKRQICQRCIVLFAVPLDRNALMGLRIRDLKWYLKRKSIPVQTCKEKTDLVDLIMGQCASASGFPTSQNERSNYTYQNYAADFMARAEAASTPTAPNPPAQLDEEEPMDFEISEPADTASTLTPPSSSSAPPSPYFASHRNRKPSAQSQSMPASPQNSQASDGYKPLTIEDITDEAQIGELSVRQLKLILTRNFVGFKGCCEKQELQEKVMWLWKQKQAHKNIDSLPDENLCKICMEAAIECVLLECGHMATCVECGKRLTECPICRQYVVRVVHTFKV